MLTRITPTLSLNLDTVVSAELLDSNADMKVTEPYVLITMVNGEKFDPWLRELNDTVRGALQMKLPTPTL